MMKLRDLVANSLPRVRGRKKKTTPVVVPPVAPHEQNNTRPALDKNANRFPPAYESRDACGETYGISEASWRGNALYRGLDAARADEFASRQVVYAKGNGLVASHSAEGFSSHLIASRSYDARMAVSDFNGSCSQMSSISETGAELYPATYFHCHYHRHNHQHHYHQHRVHGTPMSPLDQNQQAAAIRDAAYLPNYGVEVSSKRDVGFFKKSFASFKSMRKCSRASKELAEISPGADQSRCSVCPYPETVSFDRKSSDKRPAKPKRKGLKGFSRSKENKDVSKDKGEKSWFSDNDASQVVTPPPPRHEAPTAYNNTSERSRYRECSVESCVSRLYSASREGSNVREIDVTGFDSASLSGYESDFPRSKVHRSRSRIKTNPWLPSPQPSGGRRSGNSDLRESIEDIASLDEAACRVPRSASFELQRSNTFMSASLPSWKDSRNTVDDQRHRSLTPLDIKVTFGFNQSKAQVKSQVPPKLNDLNSERSSRPTSIVSPNTEFTMLADNLEQLASNISFEYEDMLDSTLESASVFHEDGQASIQELLTDEDVGKSAKKKSGSRFLKSDLLAQQSAHSPDSGVGGLTSSDADDATVSPNAGPENITLPSRQLLPVAISPSLDSRDLVSDLISNAACFYQDKNSLSLKAKPTTLGLSTSGHTGDNHIEDTAVAESDIDNTTYDSVESHDKKIGSPLLRCKTDGQRQNRSLMVNERLDIRFSPAHRHVHGTSVLVGSRHTHEFPKKMPNGMPSNRFSDPTDSNPRRLSRPSFLTSSHTMQMNDIEKCSASQLANWTDAFPFPKNISASESIESPTENNWQWDDQWEGSGRLAMQGNRDAVVPDKVVLFRSKEESLMLQSAFLKSSECIGNKPGDSDAKSISSGVMDMTSEVASLMDCIMDRVDNRPQDMSFDMSDASVQTDFDDDFSMWEEADSFDHFRSIPQEPSESTRLWLLTGNMQDSADTGYSSLTRDSQILIDEDTLFLAGELEKRKSADGLTHHDMPHRLMPISRSPRTSLHFDAQLDFNRRSSALQSEQAVALSSEVLTDIETSSKIKQPKPQKSGNPRAIPQETVNQMFSSIELQFQEIFQQIQEHEKNSPSQKQVSSKHLQSSVGNTCETVKETKETTLTDAETGENKDCIIAYESDTVFKYEPLPTHNDKARAAHDTRKQAKVKSDTPPPAIEASGRKVENEDICERGFRKLERLQEKADYLEFLKDVPLRRSHLKRPLFLVPGVGPVDMSHAEQLNMFSEIDAPAPTPSLSPVVKHTGKKQKFKKGHTPDGHQRSAVGGTKADELKRNSLFTKNAKDSFPGPSVKPYKGSQATGVVTSPQTFCNDSIPRLRTSCPTPLALQCSQDPTKSSPPRKDRLHTHDIPARDDLSGMRNLAAKVMSLRQEKELVFRKIQEAQNDEVCRQEQRSLLERSLHAKRKQALLDNLRDLRSKLEEQSRRLKP